MFSTRVSALIEAMRPAQWTKNGLVFAALIFAGKFTDKHAVLTSLAAFGVFSLLSGSTYVINDVMDAKEDRAHPVKSRRPVASGRIAPGTALVSATLCITIAIAAAFMINPMLAAAAIAYLALSLAYTLTLKHIAIVDIIAVALGFVLRAVAGAAAISVSISAWLLLCTFLLALFVILGKRRHEILLLGENGKEHRAVLLEYNTLFLDQMIAVVTAATLISYSLYTIAAETAAKLGTDKMIYTIVFVLYGLFRYLYIIYKKEGGGKPEKDILTDTPTLVNMLLWATASVLIIYYAR